MIEQDIARAGLGAGAIRSDGQAGHTVLWQNGAAIAHAGIGSYTLLLDQPASLRSGLPMLALIGGSAWRTWSAQPDALGKVWTFTLFDSAGALADAEHEVALLLVNVGGAGQNS